MNKETSNKWMQLAMNPVALPNEQVEERIYKYLKHFSEGERPPVFHVETPYEAFNLAVWLDKEKDVSIRIEDRKWIDEKANDKSHNHAYVFQYPYGSFHAGMSYFAEECVDLLGEESTQDDHDKIDALRAMSEIGMLYIHDTFVVACKPLKAIRLNETGDLHADGAPAIEFYGGKGEGHPDLNVYYLNGVNVPAWMALLPEGATNEEEFTKLKNADVRMEYVRKVGVERLLEKGSLVDSYNNRQYSDMEWIQKSEYELWDMACLYPNVPYAPHLKMKNPTTGVWHVEGVAPECKTVLDAVKFRLEVPHDEDVDVIDLA